MNQSSLYRSSAADVEDAYGCIWTDAGLGIESSDARDISAEESRRFHRRKTKIGLEKARKNAEPAGKARERYLSLTTLDLRATLTDLVTWIALANHVDPTATTHYLAIGVSVL